MITISILVFGLTSCVSKNSMPSTLNEKTISQNDNQCISPRATFSYKLLQENIPRDPPNERKILPLTPWQINDPLPAIPENAYSLEQLLVSRKDEIWMSRYVIYSDRQRGDIVPYELWKYQIGKNKWQKIPETIDSIESSTINLFVKEDDSLWMIRKQTFAKYNEESQKFELDVKGNKLFREKHPEEIKADWTVSSFMDQNGSFWIVIPGDGIFKYNPFTLDAAFFSNIPDLDVIDAAFTPGGNMILLGIGEYVSVSDEKVFRFDPETGEFHRMWIPLEEWPLFYNVLTDRSGRIWFGASGWLDPDGSWYQLSPAPVFITDQLEDRRYNLWSSPKNIFASSDGKIWYEAENGMIRLDPKAETWCWFTTERSTLVEDQNQNLWMIADGNLYMRSLIDK